MSKLTSTLLFGFLAMTFGTMHSSHATEEEGKVLSSSEESQGKEISKPKKTELLQKAFLFFFKNWYDEFGFLACFTLVGSTVGLTASSTLKELQGNDNYKDTLKSSFLVNLGFYVLFPFIIISLSALFLGLLHSVSSKKEENGTPPTSFKKHLLIFWIRSLIAGASGLLWTLLIKVENNSFIEFIKFGLKKEIVSFLFGAIYPLIFSSIVLTPLFVILKIAFYPEVPKKKETLSTTETSNTLG